MNMFTLEATCVILLANSLLKLDEFNARDGGRTLGSYVNLHVLIPCKLWCSIEVYLHCSKTKWFWYLLAQNNS